MTQSEENHRREPSWCAADSCDFYRIRPRQEVRRSSLSINVCLILGVPATSSWRAARLEPPARIRFDFFLKIEFKKWRKKIGIAELIPFSTLSPSNRVLWLTVIWLRDRKYRSDALRPNVGRFRSSARKTLWPAPFYRECNEDSLSVFLRELQALYFRNCSERRADSRDNQRGSRLITATKSATDPKKALLVKKNATQGRSISERPET